MADVVDAIMESLTVQNVRQLIDYVYRNVKADLEVRDMAIARLQHQVETLAEKLREVESTYGVALASAKAQGDSETVEVPPGPGGAAGGAPQD